VIKKQPMQRPGAEKQFYSDLQQIMD